MHDPPSRLMWLHDSTGARFGCIRLAPRDPEGGHWDCIFDVELTGAQAERSEVRWLWKRRYRRRGEHRIKQADDGTITVAQGDFKLVLVPDEQGFSTQRPAPPITARWDEPTA